MLSSASVPLPMGTREATAVLTIVDDSRLKGTETVRFKASLGAVETPAAELTVIPKRADAREDPGSPSGTGGAAPSEALPSEMCASDSSRCATILTSVRKSLPIE